MTVKAHLQNIFHANKFKVLEFKYYFCFHARNSNYDFFSCFMSNKIQNVFKLKTVSKLHGAIDNKILSLINKIKLLGTKV